MRVGHGVALASANHFEEQGLARASSAEDRRGSVRPSPSTTWASRSWTCARRATTLLEERPPTRRTRSRTLSVFRLITNFVREKRAAGEG
jgi:hypothetical protein